MSLRLIEGKVNRGAYHNVLGQDDFFPYEQIIKSSEVGPQLFPFIASLYRGLPHTEVTRNMAVDGSITPVRFSLPVPTGQVWQLMSFAFIIVDTGDFDSGGWGNDKATGLTNGMTIGVTVNGVDYNFTPIPLKRHVDLAAVSINTDYYSWGSGDNFLTMSVSLPSICDTKIRLDGGRGDTFWMQVNDDLTTLVEQRCMCRGLIEEVYLD